MCSRFMNTRNVNRPEQSANNQEFMVATWQERASVALSNSKRTKLFGCSGADLQAVKISNQQMTSEL